MRMYDLIQKKRDGVALTKQEMQFIISNYLSKGVNAIPDYQVAAFLMAVYFRGMEEEELWNFTEILQNSGEQLDLSPIEGKKIDKHSTGGVGDKTTFIVAPIVAAAGVKVAKMSGRGLGFTGGTIDKLESIPGLQTDIPVSQFFRIVSEVGFSIIGQTEQLASADKKLYALRDVTATVDSIPLIAASIMSKKLAVQSDGLLLDVKVGNGAFAKDLNVAVDLAETMLQIGKRAGRKTVALLTNMSRPLGNTIGNALEVIEAYHALQGNGSKKLIQFCLTLASNMLYLADKGTEQECQKIAYDVWENGLALQKLEQFIVAQGGKENALQKLEQMQQKTPFLEVQAKESGYVANWDARQCAKAALDLGAGRETKESNIDALAGVSLQKEVGEQVKRGEVLAVIYAQQKEKLEGAKRQLEKAYRITQEKPVDTPLIYARITENGLFWLDEKKQQKER